MTTSLLLFLVKLTVVLLLGAAVSTLSRRRSASVRHMVWAITIAASIVLPFAARTAPRLRVAVPQTWAPKAAPRWTASAPSAGVDAVGPQHPAAAAVDADPPAAPVKVHPVSVLLMLWISGFLAVVTWFVAGHVTLLRVLRHANAADDGEWNALVAESMREMNVRRDVRVVLSDKATAPFTSGAFRPVIVLPSDASTWPSPQRRAALLHELAHIARHDYLVHLLAGLGWALYWFHPVMWAALRGMRRESEQATDDLVVARGMVASDYATQLVEVAQAVWSRRVPSAAVIGMACPSNLERRVTALLDATRARGVLSAPKSAMATLLALAVIVPFAAAQPEIAAAVKVASNNVTAAAAQMARHEVTVNASTMQRDQPSKTYEKTVGARPGGTLVLDLNTGGNIVITSGDDHSVTVRGRLGGRDADLTVVETTARGDEVVVTSTVDRDGGSSTSHHFEFEVPSRFNVRIKSAGGDISINDLQGSFEGDTGGGDIKLHGLRGSAVLTTGGGDIAVADSELDGHVSTGAGEVRMRNVTGSLNGNAKTGLAVPAVPAVPAVAAVAPVHSTITINSGSDESWIDAGKTWLNSLGAIVISKDGGAVRLNEAPHGANVRTGGGSVVIGPSGGDVRADTGGGEIVLGPVAGSVKASTGAGSVRVAVTAADANVTLSTGHGTVALILPSHFNGRFEIETAYTESFGPVSIKSDWPLERDPVTGWDSHQGTPRRYVRAHGSTGSGPGLVRIRAVNGDVIVQRRN